MGLSFVGTSWPAAAASCAHLLAVQYSDADLMHVGRRPEMQTLDAWLARRTRTEDAMARLAEQLFPERLRLTPPPAGSPRWESFTLRRGQTVGRRGWRRRGEALAGTRAERYGRLTETGIALDDRVQLTLRSALDAHFEANGDPRWGQIEAAARAHRELLEAVTELSARLREVQTHVESLSGALRAKRLDDDDRARLQALPEALGPVGPWLSAVVAGGREVELEVTRQSDYTRILEGYFARDADQWRAYVGAVDPRRDSLHFLHLRLLNAQRFTEDVRAEAERQHGALRARVTETLIRLEDLYSSAREENP